MNIESLNIVIHKSRFDQKFLLKKIFHNVPLSFCSSAIAPDAEIEENKNYENDIVRNAESEIVKMKIVINEMSYECVSDNIFQR